MKKKKNPGPLSSLTVDEDFEYEEVPEGCDEVKQALGWVYTMIKSPAKERKTWKRLILDGIRNAFNPKAKEGETENLVKLLESSDVEIVGFAPNIQYIRLDGSEDFLKAWWVHPTQPTLIAKHKRLPLVFLAGPSLRFNESVIREVDPRKGVDKEDLIGFTG
jgi:hypothetical protein